MIILKTFIGFIIVVLFVILVLGVYLMVRFGSFLSMLFGNKKQNGYDAGYGGSNKRDNSKSDEPTISGQPKPRNSEFDKNEGEYVDFEELP